MIVLKAVGSMFAFSLPIMLLFGLMSVFAEKLLSILDPFWGRWFHAPIYWAVGAVYISVGVPLAVVLSVGSVTKIWGLW